MMPWRYLARYAIDFLSFKGILTPTCRSGANITSPPNLEQHLPPGRLVANPVDANGNAPAGSISLAGNEDDAVWGADLLRSHYRNVSGKGGGSSPLPVAAPANVRIMSFSTTGAGIIQHHSPPSISIDLNPFNELSCKGS